MKNLTGMSFAEARKALSKGKALTRLAWGNEDHYIVETSGSIELAADGESSHWVPTWIDIDAEDYSVVKQRQRVMSNRELSEAIENGSATPEMMADAAKRLKRGSENEV